MSNLVQPRWKRRADEIADAIGDELSVTVLAPVDIGNDVRIHSDSITALSNSISSSLPTAAEIAAAIWSESNRSVTTDALKASDLNLDVTRKLRVVSEGHTTVDITHVDGNTIASGAAVPIITAGNDTVAITGSVSTDIGNVTLPISNPNNITVPVANSNNVTVSVDVGTAAVPIKATLGGIPQNSAGNNVLVPVNPTHSVTVPVSVGNSSVPLSNPNNLTVPVANTAGVTVPVSVGGASVPTHVSAGVTVPTSVSNSLSVPVTVGSATVPVFVGSTTVPVANTNNVVCDVANTNNVTIPVTASGSVLDVKIVEIASTAPSGGVAPTEAFEAAVEDALNDTKRLKGVINFTTYWTGSSTDTNLFEILGDDGVVYTGQTVSIPGVKTLTNTGADNTFATGKTVIYQSGTSWILNTDTLGDLQGVNLTNFRRTTDINVEEIGGADVNVGTSGGGHDVRSYIYVGSGAGATGQLLHIPDEKPNANS